MDNIDSIITTEHRKLLADIRADILSDTKAYTSAGKWIDEYCLQDSYWQRYRQDIRSLIRLYKISGKSPIQYQQITDKIAQLKLKPKKTLAVCTAGICSYWSDRYAQQAFLSAQEIRCVLLLLWLLTDPCADKENTGLCRLAQLPWESKDGIECRSFFKQTLLESSNFAIFLEISVNFRIIIAKPGIIQCQTTIAKQPVGKPKDLNKAQILQNFHNYLKDKGNIKKLPKNRWQYLAAKFQYGGSNKNPGIALRNAYHRKFKGGSRL